MTPRLKKFIEEHIDLIENGRWHALYSYASSEIPFQVGNLSYNLLQAGVNPLNDLPRVLPDMFNSAGELTELELPENIISIMRNAFKDCYMLKKIVLPSSLETVDNTSFKGCYELEEIVYKGTAKQFMNNIEPTTDMFWDCKTGTIRCSDKNIFIDFDGTISIEEDQ